MTASGRVTPARRRSPPRRRRWPTSCAGCTSEHGARPSVPTMPEPLSFLGALRGAPSLVIACGLLFLEEAGLPIPIAPGEAVLIGCGLLIATGTVPFWVVIPAAYASALSGCLVGYGWARAIGPERLEVVADRLGAAGPFEHVADRLR